MAHQPDDSFVSVYKSERANEMTAESAPETVQVTLHRSREYFGKLRGYRVLLDGRPVAKIHDGETVTLGVAVMSEPHKLEIRNDWCRSQPIEFYASEGPLEFECGSTLDSFPKLFLAILYITIWYDRCFYVRPKAVSDEPIAA